MKNAVKNIVLFNKKKYILDQVKSYLVASYGIARRLSSKHIYAFNVRRSSDDATMDIGFIGNELDIASLLAFCGSDSGYIVTLYDATGNGSNATNSDTTKQPRIVNAGVLDTDGGKPCMVLDGSNDVLICAKNSIIDLTSQPLYLNIVFSTDASIAANGHVLCMNTDAGANVKYSLFYNLTNSHMTLFLEGATDNVALGADNSITKGAITVASALWNNGTMQVYDDGYASGAVDTYAGSLTSRDYLHIGARGNTGGTQTTFAKIKLSEAHIMKGNPIQGRFEADQKKYYSIASS